jgi:hypothetical protein
LNNIVSLSLLVIAAGLCFLVWKFKTEAQKWQLRFGGILDTESELKCLQEKRDGVEREYRTLLNDAARKRTSLTGEYDQALARYNTLKEEISLLEENVDDISFGLYKPHFSFDSPEDYKAALDKVRSEERQRIKDDLAAVCLIPWSVGNDFRKGERMVRQQKKLLLRAFNGECDAAIANVSWNNISKMEERIRKSFEAINKLADVQQITINKSYLNLKLDEIRLTYELQRKRYEDREEERRIKEQIREEEQAQKEIEKSREDAEADEVRFQKALQKAQAEALQATGAQLQKLTDQIATFEAKLDEARKKKERAISRAELTKSGFVYVISNIGSFGERVYKIGMTRRMEPMDRIRELGGASVPFLFDLHVMLYSDNAPELEYALHQQFEDRRVNLVNPRKEFYRNIELEEIESFVKERGLSAQFIKQIEAREYRETLAKRQQILDTAKASTVPNEFAQPLFEAEANLQTALVS